MEAGSGYLLHWPGKTQAQQEERNSTRSHQASGRAWPGHRLLPPVLHPLWGACCLQFRTCWGGGMGEGMQWSLFKATFVLSAHHFENKPRCSNSEQATPDHSESEEGRLKNIHLRHQCQPGKHVPPGGSAVRKPSLANEDHRSTSSSWVPLR